MSELAVTVNGRDYRITCAPGEEARVSKLAEYIDLRVRELSEKVGQIGDTTLMLMAGLMIADELSDAYDALESARGNEQAPESGGGGDSAEAAAVTESLDRMATRIAHLAERLENT